MGLSSFGLWVHFCGGASKLFLVPILSKSPFSPLDIITGDHVISCAWIRSTGVHHENMRAPLFIVAVMVQQMRSVPTFGKESLAVVRDPHFWAVQIRCIHLQMIRWILAAQTTKLGQSCTDLSHARQRDIISLVFWDRMGGDSHEE